MDCFPYRLFYLCSIFFSGILYVQLLSERVTVRNSKTGETLSEVPEVAISEGSDRKVVAVGSQARAAQAGQPVKLVNPFAHPRTLVSDFTIGELLLKAFVKRMGSRSILVTSPEVVMHP